MDALARLNPFAARRDPKPLDSATELRYAEQEPSPALSTHVLTYWSFAAAPDTAPHMHVIYPDGCVSLLVSSTSSVAVMFGPRTSPHETRAVPGMRVWGVRFWPDVGGRVVGVPARELRDVVRTAPAAYAGFREMLSDVHDDATAWARMEEWCTARVDSWHVPDSRVRRAVEAITATAGTIQLAELATTCDLSPRQLQRLFRDATGLTIKEYARIRRYRTALAPTLESEAQSWARLAATFGFSDHAHLSREFRTLTGTSPTGILERVAEIRHVNVRP